MYLSGRKLMYSKNKPEIELLPFSDMSRINAISLFGGGNRSN